VPRAVAAACSIEPHPLEASGRADGYKWPGRFVADEELVDRSRRPRSSPRRTAAAIADRILSVRDAHPARGTHKIVRGSTLRFWGSYEHPGYLYFWLVTVVTAGSG